MADMQGAGRIGADKLHLYLATRAGGGAAKGGPGPGNLPETVLPGSRGNEKVDESRPGNLGSTDEPFGILQLLQQGLGNLAGGLAFRLCQLHGDVAGKIAMGLVGRGIKYDGGEGLGTEDTGSAALLKGLRHQCG